MGDELATSESSNDDEPEPLEESENDRDSSFLADLAFALGLGFCDDFRRLPTGEALLGASDVSGAIAATAARAATAAARRVRCFRFGEASWLDRTADGVREKVKPPPGSRVLGADFGTSRSDDEAAEGDTDDDNEAIPDDSSWMAARRRALADRRSLFGVAGTAWPATARPLPFLALLLFKSDSR